MEIQLSQSLGYLTILVLLVLLVFMVKLAVKSRRQQKSYDRRIIVLRQLIARLRENQDSQAVKIRLSEELRQNLIAANRTLSNDILALTEELIETLTQNNLLKK